MCNKNFHSHLSPATQTHADELKTLFPNQTQFIQDVYDALTDRLAPQVNLLVMFTLLREQYQKKAVGILETYGLLYVPLSIVAKTGEQTWTRFRPRPVEELHKSFLSFMMAETNRIRLNKVCNKYGLGFGQGHCCGVLFGAPEDIARYQDSELYKQRNRFRSAAESLGMPVETVSFQKIPSQTIDLGTAEREFFEGYEDTLRRLSLPECSHEVPKEFMADMDALWGAICSATPTTVGVAA